MKKAIFGFVLAVGSVALGEDYVVTVEKGVADVTWSNVSDAGPTGLLAGGVKDRRLVKKGDGRLIIACDLQSAGYAGQICVSNGYLRLYHDGACGTSAGGVVVVDGATLEGDSGYKSGGLQYKDEDLTFEGFGVDGKCGAVHMLKSGNSTWNFFTAGKKTMTGDALWVGDSRLDVRTGIFDMGGHTLYVSNIVSFVKATVANPGRIMAIGGASATTVESDMDFTGDATNEFVFDGSGKLSLDEARIPIKWTMALSNTVTVTPRTSHNSSRTNLASAVNFDRWDGPVCIGPNATLTVVGNWLDPAKAHGPDPYHHLVNFNGRISGPGAVAVTSWYGYLRLLYPENEFAGGVSVGAGSILEAAAVGSLGTGTVSVDGTGRLDFLYGDMGISSLTEAECGRILAFRRQRAEGHDFTWMDPCVGFGAVPDATYSPDLSDGLRLWHEETNTLTLAGTVTGGPEVVNAAGTLVLAGTGENQLGAVYVRGGSLVFAKETRTFLTGVNAWKATGTYPALPWITVDTNALLACNDTVGTSAGLPRNYLGGGVGTKPFQRGVLEIRKGAVVTNQLVVGGGVQSSNELCTNDMGAVYLNGTLVNHGSNIKDSLVVGGGANGYFEIGPDGFLDASKKSEWILVGSSKTGIESRGVMQVNGGRLIHKSVGFGVNDGGGCGHLRVSDGMVSNDTLIIGKSLWSLRTGGEGVVTVEGGNLSSIGTTGVQMGGISNSVSILNLNGGVLRTTILQALTNLSQMAGGASQFCDFRNANNPSYVNFNGGTYQACQDYWFWLAPNVTRHTVYAGGVTIDDGGVSRRLDASLRAPTGNGVALVDFSCDEPWRYLGAPYVRIIDPTGAGFGASSVADFDSASGKVTGVTVTSPGCDYVAGTYAEIAFGGWTNTVRAAVTLAANACTGGFTKMGSGTLSVYSTNTWRGVTRVAGGTLTLKVDDALPNTSGVAVDAGATFRTEGRSFVTSGTLAGAGTFVGDYTLSGTFTISAADVLAKRGLTVVGRLTIAPGTRFVVTDADTLPEKLPRVRVLTATGGVTGTMTLDPEVFPDDTYSLTCSASGVRFGTPSGLAIVVR